MVAKQIQVVWSLAFWILIANAIGCGTGDVMGPLDLDPEEKATPLIAPTVRLVSPPEWRAGDTITVLGSDFVSAELGFTTVRLAGEFQDLSGAKQPVDMTFNTSFRNAGRVEFVFEPGFPPNGIGYQIGSFLGEITAKNANADETSAPSEPVRSQIEIGPSIIVWSFGPHGHTCRDNPTVTATINGVSMDAEIEVIGLTAATTYTPVQVSVAYADLYGDPREVKRRLTTGNKLEVPLEIGELVEGPVLSKDLLFNIRAEDSNGTVLSRTVALNVGFEYSIYYDGNVRIAELYPPVQASACIPGGTYGSSVNYSISESESRSRGYSMQASVSVPLWIINLGFNMSVNESVSLSSGTSLSVSGRVPPGQFGVVYRQTQRLERIGKILHRSACGDELAIGDARVTDWNWAPDLATTQNGLCPPAPPSNLPSAQVFP